MISTRHGMLRRASSLCVAGFPARAPIAHSFIPCQPRNQVLGFWVIVLIVQVLGRYMIIRYLDPKGLVLPPPSNGWMICSIELTITPRIDCYLVVAVPNLNRKQDHTLTLKPEIVSVFLFRCCFHA